MYFDSTYILVIIGAILSMIASTNVNSSFKKYSQVANSRGITGQQAARMILESAGIYDVRIERISGSLTDNYSPNEKVLRLSDSVYNSRSVAAVGVAAHECGHAIQHDVGYAPLKLRSMSVPIANIGSKISWPLILIGLILGFSPIARLGVYLFLFVVIFQLLTLPVEFNASRRALNILNTNNIFEEDEAKGARKVLTAAALTYVASLFSSVLQLLRLILLTNGGGKRRR